MINHFVHALSFAAEKHKNQRRKDAQITPYINHPIELVNVLMFRYTQKYLPISIQNHRIPHLSHQTEIVTQTVRLLSQQDKDQLLFGIDHEIGSS